MSSWFDAKHISSFAKTALNEAQKTLDKALDIKEDNDGGGVADGEAIAATEVLSTATIASSKLWGSFSGSFFDPNEKGASDQGSKEKGEGEEPSTPATTVTEAPVPPSTAEDAVDAILSQPVVSSTEQDLMTRSAILEEVDGDDLKDVQEQDDSQNPREERDGDDDGHDDDDDDGFSTSQLVIAPDAEDNQGDMEVEDSMASSAGTAVMIQSSRDEGTAAEMDPEALVSSLVHDAMAEEALSEKRSETSSSKSFEVVPKSASEVTSGDELELETRTTSSDIEVIASPTPMQPLTGPPSRCSGRRRQSHARTGSEISHAGSSTSNGETTPPQEVDRLNRKLQEMSDLLDAREVKVLELSNANFELVEKNTDLGSQVREAMRINAKLNETVLSTEDITQRMSSMEKKLQRAIVEKDSLTAANKKLKGEAKSRVPQSDIDEVMAEKDESIEGLRVEGEALSKQVGKQSEAMKKLRTKEKISEKEIKNLQSELDERKKECERLQKSLAAKDEIEMKQIEAIQSLSSANKSWEGEHLKLKSDSEDNSEKMAAMSRSLEAAYKEVAELKRGMLEKEGEAQELALSKEMAAKQALQEQLREVQEQSLKEREALFRQIDDLRASQSSEGRSNARREEQLLRERDDLLARLEASEKRNEDLSDSVSAATRPLLRQIASLQSSLNEAQASGERVERSLNERLQHASIQLAAAVERERTASEQYRQASGRTAQLEAKADALAKDRSRLEADLDCEAEKRASSDEKMAKAAAALEATKRSCAEEILDLKRGRNMAEASLESERAETTSEKRKNLSLAEQLKERDRRMREMQTEMDMARAAARTAAAAGFSRGSSPANSIGRNSINGSFTEWPEEVFDNASMGRSSATNLYDTLRNQNAGGGGAALVESLQAQLKQREGELVQVQMELGAMERAKTNMAAEVNRLSQKVERMDALETDLERLKTAYTETEQKYQTMLTMYGEKVEEAEELRLDLGDVKEVYRSQIQELMTQQNDE